MSCPLLKLVGAAVPLVMQRLVRPGILGDSRVWKDESHVNRNHTRKADDASVYETGEGSGGSSRFRALNRPGFHRDSGV